MLDTCYLRELFGRLPGVRFGSLSGSNATLFRIKEKLRQLWDKTPAGTHLVLLLTGHGDDNAMVLYGDESIDESELVRIIKTLPPKQLHVTIVFDICRENVQKAAVDVGKHIALIWSCSPGQQAWAAEFEEMTIPSSFLLIGFFMASSDASRYPGQTFEECLRLRIAQLSRFNGHLQHRRGCDGCRIRRECPDAFKTSNDYEQDVDLTQAQDALTHLHVLLARWPEFTKRCENVRVYMMGNKPFCKSNGLPVPLSRLRGVNTPVVEAAALDDVDRNGRYLIRSFPL
ncbi:dynein heavy chain, cytoplasmic [Ceratobasidium sp. AG-Ba]|nr:dynein heavy chain, cytoplasmic [Ceratobasidium sp. AG-Ba]